MKILELFSGYGTASFALKRLGIDSDIIGYSDINKYANQCFQQNHGGKELGDVKLINPNDLEDFDLLTGGFPCQAFSNAGKMQGELDPRGSLFYEIIRIAEVKQPKYMLLENVKGLTCKKFKDTFNKILSELDRIGYNVYWKVLNSKDYGIPQSRARVWFVCFRKDIDTGKFQFPNPVELKIFIKDILEQEVDKKYYLSEKQRERLLNSLDLIKKFSSLDSDIAITQTGRQYASWRGNFICANRYRTLDGKGECVEPREDGCSNTISSVQKDNLLVINTQPRNGKGQGGKGIISKEDGTAYCLDSGNNQAIAFIDVYNKKVQSISPAISNPCHNNLRCYDGIGIRKLTPKECFRLMGFLNDEIKLDGLSDTQRYKLAGNGQDVNMVSLIFKQMLQFPTIPNTPISTPTPKINETDEKAS